MLFHVFPSLLIFPVFFPFLIFPLARWSTKKLPTDKFLSLCFVLGMFIIIIIILMEGSSYSRGTSTSNSMLFYYRYMSSFFILINSCFIFIFKIVVMLFSYFFVLYSLLWFLLPTMSRSGQPQDLNTLVFLSFFHLNLLKKINFILCYTRCVLICNCLIFVCCKHLYYKC